EPTRGFAPENPSAPAFYSPPCYGNWSTSNGSISPPMANTPSRPLSLPLTTSSTNRPVPWPSSAASRPTCVRSGSCSPASSVPRRAQSGVCSNTNVSGRPSTFFSCAPKPARSTACRHSGGWIWPTPTATRASRWLTNTSARTPARRLRSEERRVGQDARGRGWRASRRRHTRFSRDWSSDVCSSDLAIWRMLEHQRFRAAVDFLQLRAEAREVDSVQAQWWMDLANADSNTRIQMVDEYQRQNTGTAVAKSRKRRRRRRKPVATQDVAAG